MKKRFLKNLCFLMVLVFALSLFVGCDKGGTSGTTTTKSSGGTTTEAEDEIKWSGNISVASYMFAPLDESKDLVGPYIEEKLLDYGYDVTIENVYIEYPQYEEIINVRIAGGTAPDIWISLSPSIMENWYDQGAIKDWDKAFFMENAPNLYEYLNNGFNDGRLADKVDLFWDLAMVDDKMITIPKFAEQNCVLYKQLIYRGDWLENLGYTNPSDPSTLPMTLDDFIDLMYRFVNDDPNKSGQNDTYAFSESICRTIFGAYGNYNGFVGSAPHWNERDGELVCADVYPENKDALALLRKCYTDGLLDPEFITKENSGGYWAISQPFINGIIGVSSHASIDHYRKKGVTGPNDAGGAVAQEYYAINGDDADFFYGPWPRGPEGHYGYTVGDAASIGENAVYNATMDDDKLGAIFGIMDAFCQDDDLAFKVQYGNEGVTFEYNDETGLPVNLLANEEMNAYGVWAYRSLYGADSPYNYNLQKTNFYENPVFKNMLSFQANPQCDSYYNSDLKAALPSDSTYKSELATYRDETWIKIITGELDVDYWDTFVQEYMAKGGSVLKQEANDWYNSK